jgi:hypothetical protein
MERLSEPATAGRSFLKVSTRRRAVLGVLLLAAACVGVVFDNWMFHAGRAMFWFIIPFLLYLLVLVWRPEWIVRMEKKDEENLRKWRSHPGQWS